MAAASAVGAPTCHRLHCLLHRPSPPSSSFSLFLKPLLISTTAVSTTPFIPRRRIISPSLPSLPSRPLLFCHSSTLSHSPPAPKASLQEAEETQQLEIPEDDDNDNERWGQATKPYGERKEGTCVLCSRLGKKLKSQLVGKSGVTASVAASFVENLESNELLKVKIHGTCPGELDDVVKQLEEATGSVIVGQIGRTVILYRPSLTKLKAEEKRQQMRKVFVRRKTYSRPTSVEFQKKGERPRTFGRDSRGRTRV
ncbi:uncharacterized protein Pyn_22687 [Prunus yedoensis var. nudiflora]|uniref:CRM domain-containing protein n=1 Tax=Prunus yedoensis var. nudiflora TaxID=2094558 RepID=A0A314UES9_PRUYE|nr:uncharacterized protein Pyn_22687 [Prunus yedoensis var. nudiflora]